MRKGMAFPVLIRKAKVLAQQLRARTMTLRRGRRVLTASQHSQQVSAILGVYALVHQESLASVHNVCTQGLVKERWLTVISIQYAFALAAPRFARRGQRAPRNASMPSSALSSEVFALVHA